MDQGARKSTLMKAIDYNIMMKAIDHRKSDQGAMDGHYHH
jgi:hypothetical protein